MCSWRTWQYYRHSTPPTGSLRCALEPGHKPLTYILPSMLCSRLPTPVLALRLTRNATKGTGSTACAQVWATQVLSDTSSHQGSVVTTRTLSGPLYCRLHYQHGPQSSSLFVQTAKICCQHHHWPWRPRHKGGDHHTPSHAAPRRPLNCPDPFIVLLHQSPVRLSPIRAYRV